MSNRLQQLHQAGQAIWLDFIDRPFLESDGLRRLVDEDGLTGVTSNPTIFEKAMTGGSAYDESLHSARAAKPDITAWEAYEREAVTDVRLAAAELRSVYDRLARRDGYVSLEVSPDLAHDADGTVLEARRLWQAVDAPNLMIKVPGTPAGARAVRQLVLEGINVNVTLLFSLKAYKQVALAFIEGLEARAATGAAIDDVASVASFFVSRIDSKIDGAIDERVRHGTSDAPSLSALRGKVAIANAKVAYAWHRRLTETRRWKVLEAQGAMPQRLLWASTGVKDAAFPSTLYADALIGPDTVNTMPPATMDAFRATGTVSPTLHNDVEGAKRVLSEADRLSLDLPSITTTLLKEGLAAFKDAAENLKLVVGQKMHAPSSPQGSC